MTTMDTPYSILIAAIAAVLPHESDVPHDASSTQIIRQSERNRIKAKLLAYADSLPASRGDA